MSAYPPEWTLCFDTEHAVVAAVKQHELEIQELQKRRRLLLSRQNSLSITGRLPHELLAEIFVALVEDWFQRYSADAYPRWEWFGILRVCHFWREIAMNTPRLWQYIRIQGHYWDASFDFPLTMSEMTELSFHLSGQVPLTVLRGPRLPTVPKDVDNTLCQLVLRNMYRIRSLSTPLDIIFSATEPHDGRNALLLESLSIPAHGQSDASIDRIDVDMIHRSAWPNLRTLEAHSSPFAFVRAALRPTLTTLIVQNSRLPHTSVETWIDLLRTLPVLKQLSLHRVMLAPQESGAVAALEPVILRSLANFSLKNSGSGKACSQLLKNLIIPTQAVLAYVAPREASEDDIEDTIKALGHHVWSRMDEPAGILLANHATGITLRLPADDTFPSLKLYSRPNVPSVPWDQPGRLKGAQPTTTIKFPKDCDIPIAALAAHYPLIHIRVVRIYCGNGSLMEEETWAPLSQLPCVCDVELSGASRPIVCELSKSLSLPGSFPALETLVFRLVQGNARRHYQHQRVLQDRHRDAVFTPMAAALARRRADGTPLKSLAIIGAQGLGTRGTDGPFEPWTRLKRQVENFKLDVRDVFEHECSSCEET